MLVYVSSKRVKNSSVFTHGSYGSYFAEMICSLLFIRNQSFKLSRKFLRNPITYGNSYYRKSRLDFGLCNETMGNTRLNITYIYKCRTTEGGSFRKRFSVANILAGQRQTFVFFFKAVVLKITKE